MREFLFIVTCSNIKPQLNSTINNHLNTNTSSLLNSSSNNTILLSLCNTPSPWPCPCTSPLLLLHQPALLSSQLIMAAVEVAAAAIMAVAQFAMDL